MALLLAASVTLAGQEATFRATTQIVSVPTTVIDAQGRLVPNLQQDQFAILDNGKVKCWGANNSGQLGLGDALNRGDNTGEMGNVLPYVNLGSGRTAKAIAAGTEFTCAILDNSTVKCWGFNQYGQLGLGDTSKRGDQPGEMGNNLVPVAFTG